MALIHNILAKGQCIILNNIPKHIEIEAKAPNAMINLSFESFFHPSIPSSSMLP